MRGRPVPRPDPRRPGARPDRPQGRLQNLARRGLHRLQRPRPRIVVPDPLRGACHATPNRRSGICPETLGAASIWTGPRLLAAAAGDSGAVPHRPRPTQERTIRLVDALRVVTANRPGLAVRAFGDHIKAHRVAGEWTG